MQGHQLHSALLIVTIVLLVLTLRRKQLATAVRALQLFSVGQYSAQYIFTCLLVTMINQIRPYFNYRW